MEKSKSNITPGLRQLIKKSFKSVFKNKLFTILLMLIIALSSSTYTLFESASNSFTQSYNEVVSDGALHDAVVKENFKVSQGSNLEIGILSNGGSILPVTEENIRNNWEQTSRTNEYLVEFDILEATKDYNWLDSQETRIKISIIDNNRMMENVVGIVNQHKIDLNRLVESNLSNIFVEKMDEIYKDELLAKNTRSISVQSGATASKVIEVSVDDQINKMYIYDGTNNITPAQTNEQLYDYLEYLIVSKGGSTDDYSFDRLKGYKVTAIDSSGNSLLVTDPSSYQAVISPAYANVNGKQSISPSEVLEYTNSIGEVDFSNIKEENIVWVDRTPFAIVGIGTTPDFMYPIIDQANPTIDINNQVLVFTNNRGYERIYDGFRNNQQENYISLKFEDSVTSNRKTEILNEIETLARTGDQDVPISYWPNNVNIVTLATDTNDIMLTQSRTVFLTEIDSIISTISYTMTTILVIFVASILVLIFGVLVRVDRKALATLLALGYSKTKIAFANGTLAFVLVVIPAMIGYLTGFGSQYAFLGRFDNYWTIPTYGSVFSWFSLVITVVIPLVLTSLLIFVITLWVLRGNVSTLLNDSSGNGGKFTHKLLKPFSLLGIKMKYTIGLSIKNIGKLSLLSITAGISMITLIMSVSTFETSSIALAATNNVNQYEFKVDLYTPTTEGGEYGTILHDDLTDITHEPTYDPNSNVDLNEPHWHVPSSGDAEFGLVDQAGVNIEGSSTYLKNKLQSKALLNKEFLGLNPWEIAERLMPENQKNISDFTTEPVDALIKSGSTEWEALSTVINDSTTSLPYTISYNNVIIDSEDELYTHVDSNFINGNQYEIVGVDENTKMFNLGNGLNSLKNSDHEFPIAINKFISEKYGLGNGSIINIDILNHVDRNQKSFETQFVDAKVVAIVDSYDDGGIFTMRNIANKLLGLDEENGFNGVMSDRENPTLLQSLPLYSPSGLYFGTDSVVGKWSSVIEATLSDPNIWKHSDVASTIDEFISVYSSTPFVSSFSNTSWSEINEYTFVNVSALTSTIISVIEGITLAISVIFTLIVATLILRMNRKKIASLKALGYRNKEIIRIFSLVYMLPLLMATVVSVPVAYGFIEALRLFIMNFANILIPFSMTWWNPIIAVVAISSIFLLSTIMTILFTSNEVMLEAFKED